MIKMEYLEEMIEQFINNLVTENGDEEKIAEKDLLILKMIE